MRRVVIPFLMLAAISAAADTIHLKSGRTIVATNVHEEDGQIKYELNDSTYGIPKSVVERIDRDDLAPDAGTRATVEPTSPVPVPAAPEPSELGLRGADTAAFKVVHSGKVDVDALNDIEKTGDNSLIAAGYFLAGRFELDHGDRETSRRYFEIALSHAPNNGFVLENYALALMKLGRNQDALSYAEQATRALPDSSDPWAALGFCYYRLDRPRDARKAWERSLALHADTNLQSYLDKLKREMAAEADYSEHDTGHFNFRYEGATKDRLRAQIMDALENDYNELSNELGISPSQSIPVILYTEQAYFDVTQAPSWTGAINDGKLRIPVQGVNAIDSGMARVLRHELAHSFIAQASGGRCPTWLNEGIAQLMEPNDGSSNGPQLARIYSQHIQIPLPRLEGSFMQLSKSEAVIAYAESLAATLYIRDMYGMSELRRILDRIAQGATLESAMKEYLHSDYADFEEELSRHLVSKYGG